MSDIIIPLPRWRAKVEHSALKIAAVIPNPRGVELHFEDQRFVPVQVDEAWCELNLVTPGDYYVVRDDGATTAVSGDHFERWMEPVPNEEKPT